jgi:hypothetical protein
MYNKNSESQFDKYWSQVYTDIGWLSSDWGLLFLTDPQSVSHPFTWGRKQTQFPKRGAFSVL